MRESSHTFLLTATFIVLLDFFVVRICRMETVAQPLPVSNWRVHCMSYQSHRIAPPRFPKTSPSPAPSLFSQGVRLYLMIQMLFLAIWRTLVSDLCRELGWFSMHIYSMSINKAYRLFCAVEGRYSIARLCSQDVHHHLGFAWIFDVARQFFVSLARVFLTYLLKLFLRFMRESP